MQGYFKVFTPITLKLVERLVEKSDRKRKNPSYSSYKGFF